ncbi:MAG: glycosyltransferase family 4 protein [Candidatus Omnitrophica bacterium]|nr:glycosyltransferase family 4 protein [Candidatus Omnitrophota bacterium]
MNQKFYITPNLTILFIPFGTSRVAATRYRIYQYLTYLNEHNIKYKVFSIISDATTRQMINSTTFKGVRKIIYYLRINCERIIRFIPILVFATQYKILFLQRTTFPFGLEKLLKHINKNIIFDLDDAIFIPDTKENSWIGRIKERTKAQEVANILKVSKLAIVENEYIRSYVRQYCQDVFLIPGPIDTERYFVKTKVNRDITIGWVGSPSTAIYLGILDEIFKELSRVSQIKIKLIGAGQYKLRGVDLTNVDWVLETEVGHLQSFDIGVMPMPDNEWTKGKLGCKMLQYMALGIPAVVSYTQTNAEVINDGINGFLVNSKDEWIEKLLHLIKDSLFRQRMGANARRTIEERFSVKVNAPRFKELLERYFGG